MKNLLFLWIFLLLAVPSRARIITVDDDGIVDFNSIQLAIDFATDGDTIIVQPPYGGTAEASKSYFGETICKTIVAGDINGDCKVNFLDFRLMALHWLECTSSAFD